MKKKLFLLPCIAAVAIATFVGAKTFKSNAVESDDLLMANVEALSAREEGDTYIAEKCYYDKKTNGQVYAYICKSGTTSNGYKDCDVVERVDRYSQSSWCIKVRRD